MRALAATVIAAAALGTGCGDGGSDGPDPTLTGEWMLVELPPIIPDTGFGGEVTLLEAGREVTGSGAAVQGTDAGSIRFDIPVVRGRHEHPRVRLELELVPVEASEGSPGTRSFEGRFDGPDRVVGTLGGLDIELLRETDAAMP